MNNGFGINDNEYKKITADNNYFRGMVIATLKSIDKRLEKGERRFNYFERRINKNSWYLTFGIGSIAMIVFLIKVVL